MTGTSIYRAISFTFIPPLSPLTDNDSARLRENLSLKGQAPQPEIQKV